MADLDPHQQRCISLSLFVSISTLLLSISIYKRSKSSSQCGSSTLSPEVKNAINISENVEAINILPGVILLKNALDIEAQLEVARHCFESGHTQRRWWCESISPHVLPTTTPRDDTKVVIKQEDGEEVITTRPTEWHLTGERQGRGRYYDAVGEFDGGDRLTTLASMCSQMATSIDNEMPQTTPTHMLLLLYAQNRKLGWHRDDGKIDGVSDQPIISISLGNASDFLLKHKPNDQPVSVRLNSGDIIVFGGPARHIMHTVYKIYENTTPVELIELDQVMRQECPSVDFANMDASSNGFRVNLTFRHAPELLGKENEERFYHFASGTRQFLDAQRSKGTEEARREANERRESKKKKSKKKGKGVVSNNTTPSIELAVPSGNSNSNNDE